MSSITDELRRIIENTAIMDEDTGSEWSVISKRMALALADAIDRDHERCIEQQSHDLLKASVEYLRKENIDWEDKYRDLAGRYAKLSALCIDMFVEFVMEHGSEDDIHEYRSRIHDSGIEV